MTFPVSAASRVPQKSVTKRKALLISCASAAIAAGVMTPQKARAQAFDGTMTANPGTTRTFTGTGAETITVNTDASGTATINWAPNEAGTGNINFLPAGNAATFTSQNGLDFTVLNRVVPDGVRAIELNGTVLSKLAGDTTGGNVWFYSPNGIVVGGTAVFDVGGLLLTTNDVTSFSMDGSGFSGTFSAPANTLASVSVAAGARINALQQNSYVALVAPRVEQHGTVQVDGAAAYVGGEQVTMTMNQGLFDIQVDVGTTDGNGVVHTGTTGGPASTGVGDNHRIYMVAVPKNEALTMLLSGGAGFDATTAGVVNGEIVLSSGSNVLEADGSRVISPPTSIQSNISIDGGIYLSDFSAQAAGNIFAIANEGLLSFSRDATLISFRAANEGRAHVGAINGGNVSIGRDLVLVANRGGTVTESVLYANTNGSVFIGRNADVRGFHDFGQGDAIAGINSDSGSIAVIGATSLLSTLSAPNFAEGPSDGGGGAINVLASNGGTFTTGTLSAQADGRGQDDFFGSGFAADGFGGDINIVASSAGLITVNGNLQANADGYGGDAIVSSGFAGFGQGGNVRVAGDGGTVTITGQASLSANGQGGIYGGEGDPFDVVSGDGIGGWARFETTAPASAINIGGDVIVNANGFGGNGQFGGAGFGGGAGVQSFAGAIDVTGSITLNANGVGGDASFGGDGGYGEGGSAYIQAELTNGPSASITGGDAFLDANGIGGDGGDGFVAGIEVNIAPGAGGTGHGGYYFEDIETVHLGGAFVLADAAGASVELGNLQLHATGTGGAGGEGWTGQSGGAGGNAFGGTVQAGSFDPDEQGATLGSASFGNVTMDASAYAGDGGAGDFGNGGAADGSGGMAFAGGSYTCTDGQFLCGGAFLNAKGSVDVGDVWMGAQAWGGDGFNGGLALGGIASMEITPGSSLISTAELELSAAAWGGYGNGGTGGDATGGTSEVLIEDGSLAVSGRVFIDSGAVGGGGGTGGASGGNGTGGDSVLEVLGGGSVEANEVLVWSPGYGGNADVDGGDGIGGDGLITVSGTDSEIEPNASRLSANSIGVDVFGWGGSGTLGFAGIGDGGFASITVDAGGDLTFGSELFARSEAFGNTSLAGGGDVLGGISTIIANGVGSSILGGAIFVESGAVAGQTTGSSGVGANATGGESRLHIANGASVTGGSILVESGALGGNGSKFGGNAQGGASEILMDAAGLLANGNINVTADATGGMGGIADGQGPGAAGTGTGGTASITFTEVSGASIFGETMVIISAQGFGGTGMDNGAGTGGTGGTGDGGSTNLVINGGAQMFANGGLLMQARGVGGDGGSGSTGGTGGSAVGGDNVLNIINGDLTAGVMTAEVRAVGGDGGVGSSGLGGDGGSAQGGTNAFLVEAASSVDGAAYSAFTNGIGGWGGSGTTGFGNGGDAEAGSHTLTFNGSDSQFAGNVVATSFAWGGKGATGGDAIGGTSSITINGSLNAVGNVQASGQSEGGEGFSGAGGSADSGTASIDVNGSLNAGRFFVGANAIGGAGATDGGIATGGSASFNVNAGTVQAGGLSTVEAKGTGGDAGTGTGGGANGGTATFFVESGATANIASLDVTVDGFGGNSTFGQGADAVAGTAWIESQGSLTATGDVFVSSDGEGGDGATGGGFGAGNDAAARINGGTVQFLGSLTVRAAGTGGTSSGGTGGAGFGGYARMSTFAGGDATANDVTIDSSGDGGDGINGGEGVGGQNFQGFGGSVIQVLDAGSTLTLTGSTTVTSNGIGGDSIGPNGNGGDGTGGFASVGAFPGTPLTADSIFVEASGIGGDGSGTGTAGSAVGGTARLVADGGTIDATGVTILAHGTAGTGGSVGGEGEGGFVELLLLDGVVTPGFVTLASNGTTTGGEIRIDIDTIETGSSLDATALDATANGGDFAGDVLVDVAGGSTADFGSATLTANGGIPASGEDGIELDIEGELDAANLALTSSDDIQINTLLGGQIIVDGTLAADSLGLITISDNGSFGPVNATVVDLDGADIAFDATVNADDILFTVDGDYALAELPFASNSLSITAGGDITAAETVSYATSLLLNAGVDITTVDIFTGGDLSLSAIGNIATGNLSTGQNLTLNAGGDITAGDMSAGLGVAAGAGGNLTVGNVSSGVPVGDIVGQAVVASGQDILLAAGGDVSAQTITSGGALALEAGGSFTVGGVSASDAVFTAGDMASFLGTIDAATISVTSGDITIADGASLGADGITDLITFNAVSDGTEILLGGDGTEGAEGQYQLAEDGDIIANSVVFNAVAPEGGSAPDIRVLDAEIDGSQNADGGVAHVTLNTDANVFVAGQIAFADAAATDTISINAGDTIQVITDAGGIAMTDSNGDLSGVLELTAHDIWVADQATLDQIATDPTFSDAEALLSINNGPVNPAGAIQAGGLTVTMLGSSFLVQNTGSDTELAGLTVGQDGLSIVNQGSEPATVIIYGRQQAGDGSFLTGDAFFEEVEFSGTGGFSGGSNVNGCEVSGGCGPDISEEPPVGGVESILGPVGLMNDPKGAVTGDDEFASLSEEEGEEEEEEEGEEGSGGVDAGSSLINTGPVSIDTPIDEPVTSGSDTPGGAN